MSKERVLLFDLGGVLIQLGEYPFPPHWMGIDQNFRLPDWFKSDVAQQFERGEINASHFALAMKEDLNLSVSAEEICLEFLKWPQGPYDGTYELLKALKEKHRLTVLTNTNELHWPRIVEEFAIPNFCSDIFASHILGMAKPDPSIYEHVLSKLRVPAETVVFFDDNLSNVEAAEKLGLQSYLVKGHQELLQKIQMLGLLT